MLSIQEVWEEFNNNPMVTITRDEDNMIKASGQNSKGDMQSRYTALGITLLTLPETPLEYHKKSRNK